MNMVINAADAMPEGGTLAIKSKFSSENDSVEITIEDSGCGIPKEVIDRIYDPFFTTKEQKRGTGLGLAVSYGIIKKHQGSILVESEVGKGTIFTIRLPRKPIESNEHPAFVESMSEGIVT
jgi:signal transduction histidine kinase